MANSPQKGSNQTLAELSDSLERDRRQFREIAPLVMLMGYEGFDAVVAKGGLEAAKRLAKTCAAHICLTMMEKTATIAALEAIKDKGGESKK